MVGKAGDEGKLIGVDLCKVDTITFSPKVATPRELLEKWLGATAELAKIGIDPSNATADYETSTDGTTTTLKIRPKDPAAQSGINVAIAQFNTPETARATVAVLGDQHKADGWTVDSTTPAGLGDRGFLMAGKSDGTIMTLFFVVQVFDRLAVVSVTGSSAGADAMSQASTNLIVDLLKTLDPTIK